MNGMSPAISTRCFGPGLGRAHEFEIALGEDVDSSFIDRVIRRDPVAVRQMVVLSKGQPFSYNFDTILEREKYWLEIICADAGVKYPGDDPIKAALEKTGEVKGTVTEHDRVILGKLGLPHIFQGFYRLNERRVHDGREPVKLYTEQGKEFWRADSSIQHLLTEFGVLRQDFGRVMRPTDARHRPFNLIAREMDAWAQELGDGLTSAEETCYLCLRFELEFGVPLWSGASAHCRNAYGSGCSVYVRSSAIDGFVVGYVVRYGQGCFWGALAREFVPFGA